MGRDGSGDAPSGRTGDFLCACRQRRPARGGGGNDAHRGLAAFIGGGQAHATTAAAHDTTGRRRGASLSVCKTGVAAA
ncbi:hypothetical protein Dimus_030007, partial [Dionaea muscipula]